MADKEILPPRAAGRYIAEHSRDVKVSQDGVEKTAKKACGFGAFISSECIN